MIHSSKLTNLGYAATNITAAWVASRAAVLFCTLLSQRLQSTNFNIQGVLP